MGNSKKVKPRQTSQMALFPKDNPAPGNRHYCPARFEWIDTASCIVQQTRTADNCEKGGFRRECAVKCGYFKG